MPEIPSPFSTLNDDLFLEIFKFLSQKQLTLIASVNKKWKINSENDFLWKESVGNFFRK